MPVDKETSLLGRGAVVGAVIYIATIPLEGLLHLGVLGSLAKGGGVLLVASAGFALIGGALRIRRTDGSILIFGAFVAWAVLSYYWSADKGETLTRTITNLQLFVATLVLWQYLGTRARLRLAVQTYVVGAFLGSVYSIVARHPHANGVERYSVGGPNSFGVEVVWAMLAAYWLLGQPGSQRWKRFYVAFFVVGTIEVFSTASRTALVTLIAAGIVAVADRRYMRMRYFAAAGAVAAAAGVAVLHFVSSRQLNRLGTTAQAATTGLNGRSTQWRLALDVFSSHPVEGIGAAVFRDYSAAQIGISKVAHNSFLGVAADLGAVGLTLFITMFVYACRGLWLLEPTARRLWFGLVGVWLIGASTLTWENQKFTFFVLVVVAAQSVLARTPEPAALLPEVAAAHQD